MISTIKNIFNSIKDSSTAVTHTASEEFAQFKLSYKDLTIGTLEFSFKDDSWKFSYSEEFINQEDIAPILSFPDKTKVYEGKKLWSFFSSRIPDNVGSDASSSKSNVANKDIFTLLKSYGQKTITNPFNLSIA